VERYHPDNAVTNRIINLFNDNAMSHFRNILKCRQKQISLGRFLVKQGPNESQAESSGAKRRKREREKIPGQLPDVFIEGDSPSKQ
jgi:hypothetical protein